MARLVWDQTAERLYETGIRNCVAYPFDRRREHPYSPGVAWNGLTSIKQNPNVKFNPVYADDIRYLNLPKESLTLTIDAYTYPDVIAVADGSTDLARGIKLSQQRRKIFGISYRSVVGNDVELDDYGYKLHLIYGCMAAPVEKPFATVNQSVGPITFTWDVITNPISVQGFKPLSIVTIDSAKCASTPEGLSNLLKLQDIIWGTDKEDPYLPLPWEVVEIFTAKKWYLVDELGQILMDEYGNCYLDADRDPRR